MPLFRYPKGRHRRSQEPPQYSSYRRYKPHLRTEFSQTCVYCRLPDGIKTPDSFHIDHYRPKSKFPQLLTQYSNLFYSCPSCNVRKGDYWPPDDELVAIIPNPCDHVMFAHLRYHGAEVEAHSRTGEFAIETLDLNDPTDVEYRAFTISALNNFEDDIRRLESHLQRTDWVGPEHAAEIEQLQDDLARIKGFRDLILGRP